MAAAMLLLTACHKHKAPVLEDATDTFSWILGRNTVEGINAGPFKDIDHDIFMRAVEATFNGEPQPIDDSTYNLALKELTKILQMQMQRQASDRKTTVDQQQEEYFAQLVAENPTSRNIHQVSTTKCSKKGKARRLSMPHTSTSTTAATQCLTANLMTRPTANASPSTTSSASPCSKASLKA